MLTITYKTLDNNLLMKGMGMVEEEYRLKEVKKEIENKRINLNQLVIKGINRDELLKFSVELDNLIVKYYDIKLDRQRADS